MESSDKYRFVSFCHSIDCANVLDSDLYIRDCGIEKCVSAEKYGPCLIEGYHIYIVLAGKGTLYLKSQSWKLTAGMIFILPDGLEMEHEADSTDPWQYAWVTFGGRNVASCLKGAGFSKSLVRKCNCNPDRFVEIIDKIMGTAEPTFSNELRRNSYLYEILALLVETGKVKKEDHCNDPQDLYVRNAVQYIHRNYTHARVNDIASYVGINRSYLTTIFKNKLKVSPQEYLVNYRLSKSRQLLQTTDLSIQDIAYRVGYDNPLTFSKMFKNAYGISPKHYRSGFSPKSVPDEKRTVNL